MISARADLGGDRDKEDPKKNRGADRIAELERHGERVAARLTQRSRTNLDQPERQRPQEPCSGELWERSPAWCSVFAHPRRTAMFLLQISSSLPPFVRQQFARKWTVTFPSQNERATFCLRWIRAWRASRRVALGDRTRAQRRALPGAT